MLSQLTKIAVDLAIPERKAGLIGQILDLIDDAAALFSLAVQGPEGIEGTTAYLQKRAPRWVRD